MTNLRRLFITFLIIGVFTAFTRAPAGALLLGRVDQIHHLYYDNGTWYRILPDGTTQTFNLKSGESLVMTGLYIRFYATTVNTGPYRLYLKASNGTNMWTQPLNNFLYPTTGSTVWGGGNTQKLDPGVILSGIPAVEVRQLPQPPANPNTGPVIPGAMYMRVTGYILP